MGGEKSSAPLFVVFVVFFVWEDFFEVVAIIGRIIQKKGNVVKGVVFGS